MESKKLHGIAATIEQREATNSQDVIVVGGGLAGLASAALLARSGQKVTLFERSAQLGGRAISQEHNGFLFNLGPHALYSHSPALEVLRELGVQVTGGSPKGIRYVRAGKSYMAPVDAPTLLKTSVLSAQGKWEAARLLVKLQLADPHTLAGMTVAEWLDREVRRPEVRDVLETSFRVATYTNAPGILSMSAAAEQFQLAARSKAIYVDGGWQTLVDGLENAARRAGVRIQTGARVASVEDSGGKACGVRMDDGTLQTAQAVVVAAGPRDATKLMAGTTGHALHDWVARTVPVQAACLDVALRRLPQPRNRAVLAVDRPLFLTIQSEFSRVAPEGRALAYALKYLDPAKPVDARSNEAELEGWLDELQPGWRNELIERRYLPHLTVSNVLPAASLGGTDGRPGPEVQGTRNLYIVGDWVGPKAMLANTSLWSAREAANAILDGIAGRAGSKAA